MIDGKACYFFHSVNLRNENKGFGEGSFCVTEEMTPWHENTAGTGSYGFPTMEIVGFEPMTSWMPFKRSPSWAIPPCNLVCILSQLQQSVKQKVKFYVNFSREFRNRAENGGRNGRGTEKILISMLLFLCYTDRRWRAGGEKELCMMMFIRCIWKK